MTNSPKFSFIIPLFNENEVFSELIERLKAIISKIPEPCEVVMIDDGSSDITPRLMEEIALEDKRFHCIFLSRNFGHQFALSAGIEYASGDFLMILDGDLQDTPELFFEFYKKIKEGYDVVYGIRTNRKEGLLKKTSYFVFYRLLNKIASNHIPLDSGDFAMITKRVARLIASMPEQSRYLRGMRSWVGFKQAGIAYERMARNAGESKYTLRDLFQLGRDGIFNFSTFPIKLFSYLGISCILLAVTYFIHTILRRIFIGDVPTGFTALLFMIILFGGLHLLFMGIVGEYVQRIFFQVKNRPLFIVSKRIKNGEEVTV